MSLWIILEKPLPQPMTAFLEDPVDPSDLVVLDAQVDLVDPVKANKHSRMRDGQSCETKQTQ